MASFKLTLTALEEAYAAELMEDPMMESTVAVVMVAVLIKVPQFLSILPSAIPLVIVANSWLDSCLAFMVLATASITFLGSPASCWSRCLSSKVMVSWASISSCTSCHLLLLLACWCSGTQNHGSNGCIIVLLYSYQCTTNTETYWKKMTFVVTYFREKTW